MKNKSRKSIQKLREHYNSLFLKYKNSVSTSQQSSRRTQNKRMYILTKYIYLKKTDSVLDFGCGTAYLHKYLKNKKNFKGKYCGCDISNLIINNNIKKNKDPKATFINQDILEKKIKTNYDYILINGTFNNYTGDNLLWMKRVLIELFKITKKKLIFNNLSTFVDYRDKKLFYINPLEVFSFCKKNLSKNVSLIHDYHIKKNIIPYEFTTIVSKSST